jgi:mono/diheme cytochrome c family protein
VRPAPALGLVALAALAALGCSGVPVRESGQTPAPAPAPAAPGGTAPAAAGPAPAAQPAAVTSAGLEIVRNDCLACHSEDLLKQQRLTRAQWAKTIDKMHTWGAPTEPENIEPLTTYLAATYGHDAGPFTPESFAADKAAALFVPAPGGASGDRGRGQTIYGDQCVACHEEGARGGPDGVALAGRRILDRPEDFAALLRSGRGRMPDFSGITDAELADLLAYLRSLP